MSSAASRLLVRGALYRGHRGGTGCPQASSFGEFAKEGFDLLFGRGHLHAGQHGGRGAQVSQRRRDLGHPAM